MPSSIRLDSTAITVAVGVAFLVALVGATVFFTRDGGDLGDAVSDAGAWTARDSGVSNTLLDVHFLDAARGWAVGQGGAIVATTDGGQTWTRQDSGFELAIRGVHFSDARNGWAVGHLGLILRTTDGGRTWTTQGADAALGQNLIRVRAADALTGWIIAERGSFALRTSDGGETWERRFFDNTLPRSDAFVMDGKRAWVAFTGGGVLSTDDGGESWTALKGVNSVQIGTSGIHFADALNGWIVGWRGKRQGVASGVQMVKYLTDGFVARTTDGGQTWTRVDADTGKFLYDVAFSDARNGWAVGSYGQAMRSSDGGATWEIHPTPTELTLRSVAYSTPETVWAVGEGGVVLRFGR